ncbi:BapA prefix-like domain-containing protein, partial [Ralstonia pseudosolanacearum]|uniref:BapA prefix-like domain-containing protein n=1 Tax=Ralstonia pseudosolanacearum TaxID=1310165 RepID=UPI003221FC12
MVSPSVLSNHTDIPVTSTTTFVTAPNGPANFLVAAHKDDVANYARSGNDLVVEFKDGHALRLQGFFANGTDFHNLVFQQEDGRMLAVFDGALTAEGDGIVDGGDRLGQGAARVGIGRAL